MPKVVTYHLISSVNFLLPIEVTQRRYPIAPNVTIDHPRLGATSEFDKAFMLHVPDELLWFATPQLTFRTTDEFAGDPQDYSLLDSLLGRLRRLSRQASIPRNFAWVSFGEDDGQEDETIEVPETLSQKQDVHMSKMTYATSVTEQHLQALATDDGVTEPIHEVLLLDAIEALTGRNYRSAIVYAAFAAEAAANAALAIAFQDAIHQRPAHLRVTRFALAGGREVFKEPVYEALAMRDDFRTLLHERPLYLMQRSLLVEREPLYQALRKLYRTRNEIVHSSEKKDETFELSEADATKCIESVIALLEWFNLPSNFVLPGGTINVRTGRAIDF